MSNRDSIEPIPVEKSIEDKEAFSGDALMDKSWQQHWQNHSDPAVRDRFEIALNFYREAGYTEDKTLQQMKGINFNREVTVETINPGEVLKQYQQANREGNYFTKDSDKSELGIQGDSLSSQNRLPELYVANQEFQALKSTSSDLEWGKNKELYYGGGIQYFIPETDKGSLTRWDRAENKTDTLHNNSPHISDVFLSKEKEEIQAKEKEATVGQDNSHNVQIETFDRQEIEHDEYDAYSY